MARDKSLFYPHESMFLQDFVYSSGCPWPPCRDMLIKSWTLVFQYQNKFPGSQAKVTALVRDFVEVTWWNWEVFVFLEMAGWKDL